MKKGITLLALSFVSLPIIAGCSQKISPYKEATIDLLNHSKSLQLGEITEADESVVYDTYAQYGESNTGKKYLRFLTPFKASLDKDLSLNYTRTYGSDVKEYDVRSVYEGVKNGDSTMYWSGTAWTTVAEEREENAYIATYTIEFNSDVEGFVSEAYGYEITASLTLKEGETTKTSTPKTTSVNKTYDHKGRTIYFKSNVLENAEEWYEDGLSTSAKFFDENNEKIGTTTYGTTGIALSNPGHFNGTQYWSFTVPSKAKYVQFYKVTDTKYNPTYKNSKSEIMPLKVDADLYEVDPSQATLKEGESGDYFVKLTTSTIDLEAIKREEVKVDVSLSDDKAATYKVDKKLIMKDDEVTVSLTLVDGYSISAIYVNNKVLPTIESTFKFVASKSTNVVYVELSEETATIPDTAIGEYTEEYETFNLVVEENKATITMLSAVKNGNYTFELAYTETYKHTSNGVKFKYANEKGEQAEIIYSSKGAVVSNIKYLKNGTLESMLKTSFNTTKVIHMESITSVTISPLTENEDGNFEALVGEKAYIYTEDIKYLPTNANSTNFVFTSLNEEAISVNYEDGEYTYATLEFLKSADEAYVKISDASNPEVNYTLHFVVKDVVYPNGINITTPSTEVEQGSSLELSASFTNASSITTKENNITWKVKNEDEATFGGKPIATISYNKNDTFKATLSTKKDNGAVGNVIVTASVPVADGNKVEKSIIITIKPLSLDDKEYGPMIGTWEGEDYVNSYFEFVVSNDGSATLFIACDEHSFKYDSKVNNEYTFIDKENEGVQFIFTLADDDDTKATLTFDDPEYVYDGNLFYQAEYMLVKTSS